MTPVEVPLDSADPVSLKQDEQTQALPKGQVCFPGKDQTGSSPSPSATALPPARVSGAANILRPPRSLFPHIMPSVMRPLSFSVPGTSCPVPQEPPNRPLASSLIPQGASSPGQCCQKDPPQSTALTTPARYSAACDGPPTHGIRPMCLISVSRSFIPGCNLYVQLHVSLQTDMIPPLRPSCSKST